MQRRYDLDWLRVMAFALLMLFHTGMLFSTWDWHVKNLETSDAFDNVMRFLHDWRMPLLFFISGSAVWFAMGRYSAWGYFRERQKRLLLPLAFGMLVVIPPQVYYERLYHHQLYASFWDFYGTEFTSGTYPEGNLSWHHLWYVPYIWVYSMITLPLFVWVRSRTGRALLERTLKRMETPWLLFLVFVPSALSDLAVRPFWPRDEMNLVADWGNFSHKLTFFVIGFLLASGTGVYDMIAAHRRKFLFTGIAALAVIHPIWVSSPHFPSVAVAAYRVFHNFHIWMWILAVLGYGRHYLSFNHPFLRYANEAVYPFYILHQTVIVILGYYLVYVNWPILPKFVVVVTGMFLITWGLYVFAIKPWSLMRVAFGMKWAPSTGRPNAERPRLPALTATGSACLVFLALLSFSGCSPSGGRLVSRTFQAPSLSQNRMGISDRQQLAIYLPPSYGQGDRRFPVLYFLPNFNNCLFRYTGASYQRFRLREAMDRQIRQGAAREMVVVIPNTVHSLGGSWYKDSPLTGNWEDYIVRDVVAYMDTHFRTIPEARARGLAGHGVGGSGALELALNHPEVFGSVYAMSPALFDQDGLRDLGLLSEGQMRKWQAEVEQWNQEDPVTRRKSFRDYVHRCLNSPSRERSFEGLRVSYAAAVASDLSRPYPHIAFPTPTASPELLARYQNGLGGWPGKIREYLAKERPLATITIEYGKDDEYEWLRRGANYVSQLMRSLGVANTLAVHEGGHDSTLGQRLESAMLPAMSNVLRSER